VQAVELRLKYEHILSVALVEANRIKIVAKKEEADRNLEIDALDARWDMETYQYGANLMAAPGGGTMVPTRGGSAAASVLGGVMSGAASGASLGTSVSPGYGTLIGGILGAVGGGLMGSQQS
jgi:hypothetical protein